MYERMVLLPNCVSFISTHIGFRDGFFTGPLLRSVNVLLWRGRVVTGHTRAYNISSTVMQMMMCEVA